MIHPAHTAAGMVDLGAPEHIDPGPFMPMPLARVLSNIARYQGAFRHDGDWWSVLDHSLVCARVVKRLTSALVPTHDATVAALLHDAPEAVTGDITRPMQRTLGVEGAYNALQAKIATVVWRAYNLPGPSEAPHIHALVRQIDDAVGRAERSIFFGQIRRPTEPLHDIDKAAEIEIETWLNELQLGEGDPSVDVQVEFLALLEGAQTRRGENMPAPTLSCRLCASFFPFTDNVVRPRAGVPPQADGRCTRKRLSGDAEFRSASDGCLDFTRANRGEGAR